MSEAKRMTDDELVQARLCRGRGYGLVTALLAHIDALTAERDEAVDMLRERDEEMDAVRDRAQAAEAQLREAREAALEEAARLVETSVISGPEDDEVDHDDYRDMRMAAAIRKLKAHP